jgi:two-component system response regulator AtoC
VARVLITDTTLMDEHDGGPMEGSQGIHLLVMSPEMFGTHPLPATGAITIGRSTTADIQIHDPLASRRHAVLHIGETLTIEDLRSANGTRVRDVPIKSETHVPITPGEAIVIGGTCLMVQQNRAPVGPRRLWSHSYFENRVEEECTRCRAEGTTFGIARIRIDRSASWMRVVPTLVAELKPPHLLAAYGPNEYEVLFQGVDPVEAERLLRCVVSGVREAGYGAHFGVAWFPSNGRSPDALVAHACAPFRAASSAQSEQVGPIEPVMQRIYEIAARAAAGNINVMILGETGVGKEVLAQTVHQLSPRSDKPIVCLNCAAFSETLLESELLGHERGSFTGANSAKPGQLEMAHGGTVFLDEVGELPLPIQAKLLRVIQTREVTRLGGLRPRTIDVRFISATNRDLESEVLRGNFRRDLFFRLNGISLTIPPLRERVEEIPAFAKKFLAEFCHDYGRKPELRISARALALLKGYSWLGNVRELRNVIERAVVLCTGFEIGPEHLPLDKIRPAVIEPDQLDPLIAPFAGGSIGAAPVEATLETLKSQSAEPPALSRPYPTSSDPGTIPPPSPVSSLPPISLDRWAPNPAFMHVEEYRRIIEALAACAGNQSRAAKMINMPRRTFVTKLEMYAIPRPQKAAVKDAVPSASLTDAGPLGVNPAESSDRDDASRAD